MLKRIIQRLGERDLQHQTKYDYQTVFRSFPLASAICGKDGVIVDVNHTLLEMIHCTRDDLIGHSFLSLFQLGHSEPAAAGLESMTDEACVYHAVLISGASVEVTLIPYSEKPESPKILVVFADKTEIQEWKKNFDRLKENMLHGQQITKTGSWTHDILNDEIFLSDEVYHILECGPEEFDGNLETYYSFIHPDDLEAVKQATGGALSGKEYDLEYRIIASNGTEKYVHEKTKALYDESGRPSKMIGIFQDITYYKLIENNLKAFGDELSTAQRISGTGSWKYDVLKDEIFGSEEYYRILQADPLTFGRDYDSYLKRIHPDDQVKMQNAMADCLEGRAFEAELRILLDDGAERYVICKGNPTFDDRQQITVAMGTIHDVTEKAVLENKLKKSLQIRADRRRGRAAGGQGAHP